MRSSPPRIAAAPPHASSHPARDKRRGGSRRCCRHPQGQALYRRRQQIVEPVFAHTKFIRRVDRFLRRGHAACEAEWQLIAATHNLLKLWRAGLAPTAATG